MKRKLAGDSSRTAILFTGSEIVCWTLGLALLGLYVSACTDALLASDRDLGAFEEARLALAAQVEPPSRGQHRSGVIGSLAGIPEPDRSLWAQGRIERYEQSLRRELGPLEAVLRIPSIGLTVPVYGETSELNLNRGVARIEGTARTGAPGNLGIAGHRDGYFRGLKDVSVGDRLEVQTLSGSVHYGISELMVVEPTDVYVLEPTDERTITLVTCYPFYFVGPAPRRFIVRGVAMD